MSTKNFSVRKVSLNAKTKSFTDVLAEEEPLEINLTYWNKNCKFRQSLSLTMRTPGNDHDLVRGFIFSEGIIQTEADIKSLKSCGPLLKGGHQNIVRLELDRKCVFSPQVLSRNFLSSSSCGICGKSSLEALTSTRLQKMKRKREAVSIRKETLFSLPDRFSDSQVLFARTGGMHGVGLFDLEGQLVLSGEDVGRHNALDKVIGKALKRYPIPLRNHILFLSGRVSFELVQKAIVAGVPLIVALGAPSSLAIEMAHEYGLALIGFLRERQLNIYSDLGLILK